MHQWLWRIFGGGGLWLWPFSVEAEAACFGARRRQLLRAQILADSGEFFGGFGGVRLSWQTDAVTRRLSPFFVDSDLALARWRPFVREADSALAGRSQKRPFLTDSDSALAEAAVFVGVRFRADGGGGGVYWHCRQRVPLAFFGGG